MRLPSARQSRASPDAGPGGHPDGSVGFRRVASAPCSALMGTAGCPRSSLLSKACATGSWSCPACGCTWHRPGPGSRGAAARLPRALVGMAPFMPKLAQHYLVIAPDLRGAGWSDAATDGYTEEQLVRRRRAVGRARTGPRAPRWTRHRRHPRVPVCLAHPDRVRRFVFIASPHPYGLSSKRVLLRMLPKAWRLWPGLATAAPVLGPRLLGAGKQRLARHMMLGDTPRPDVWSPQDLDVFLSRLRDPFAPEPPSRSTRHSPSARTTGPRPAPTAGPARHANPRPL